ncbi:hypothetical protein ZEAMMB73_Zm00001d039622 [Zea mays]|uniref:Uncharacterized protein n=1 Tax=Zea mays TaxID=4577 RepID=A0A1D6MJT9_MAIZE|nr:hypothetical protein ZEAMMB73_Zm00001d039622 [Zea mays]
MLPTGGAAADGPAVGSSSSAFKAKSFILDPPLPVVVHSTTLPTPNPTSGKALLCYTGSKRSRSENMCQNLSGLCLHQNDGSGSGSGAAATNDGCGSGCGAADVGRDTLPSGGGSDKKVGSIVSDLEVIEAIVSNLKVEDDDVIDSDGDIDGLNADDQSYFDM